VSADKVVFAWNETCTTARWTTVETLRLVVASDLNIHEARVHVTHVQCESARSPMLVQVSFSIPVSEEEPARIDVLNDLVREDQTVGAAAGVLAVIPLGATDDVDVDSSPDMYYGGLVDDDGDDGGEGGGAVDREADGDDGIFTPSTIVMLALAIFIVCFLLVLIATRVRRMNRERSATEAPDRVYGSPTERTLDSIVPASRGVTGSGGYHLPPARDEYLDGVDTFSSLGVQVEFLIHGRELVRLNKIGEGAFGLVLRGSWGDKEVAIKEVKGTSAEARTQLLDEGTKLTKLPPHENVVTFYGVCDSPPAIVLQFCDGGSLLSRLYGKQEGVKSLAELERQSIALDIARGLEHLHRSRVVHRDVAARNVLLHEGVAKLTDMGLSRDSIDPTEDDGYLNAAYEPVDNYYQQTRSATGPLKWMAPEQLTQRIISFKADVYSFGIVMYELYAAEAPWAGLTAIEAAARVIGGSSHRIAPQAPAVIAAAMVGCMRQDPHDRPSMHQVVKALSKEYGARGTMTLGEPLHLTEDEDAEARPDVKRLLDLYFVRQVRGGSVDGSYGPSPGLDGEGGYDTVPPIGALPRAASRRSKGGSRVGSRRRKNKPVAAKPQSRRGSVQGLALSPVRNGSAQMPSRKGSAQAGANRSRKNSTSQAGSLSSSARSIRASPRPPDITEHRNRVRSYSAALSDDSDLSTGLTTSPSPGRRGVRATSAMAVIAAVGDETTDFELFRSRKRSSGGMSSSMER
jgi:serine/threonine protein kinase